MSAKLDAAILRTLSLDPSNASISSYGGAGFSSTFKISSTVNGIQKLFFIKTGMGKDSELMFAGIYFQLESFGNVPNEALQELPAYTRAQIM